MLRSDVLVVMVCGAFALSPRAPGRSEPRLAQDAELAADLRDGPSRPSDEIPEGPTTSDWSCIREAYETQRHAACAAEDGYRARNPGQRWVTHFDGRGFSVQPDAGGWEWGLQLERYGFAGDERVVSEPLAVSAAGQRVAYDWDGVLEEWYLNDPRGLEHGYTVHERPARRAPGEQEALIVTLSVRGALRPEVTDGGRSVRFGNGAHKAVLTYAGLSVVDADGKELAAGFRRVGEGLLLSIDESGARYPLTIDPIAQQAYLKASNPGGPSPPFPFFGDLFGSSVAAAGDTVVVGAPSEDSNATGVNGDQGNNLFIDSGAAYVFVRNGSGWSQQAYLKASNTGGGDSFGTSVALAGDTLVVGAPGESSDASGVNGDQSNNNLQASGAAYVFVRSGTTWSQEAYLKASNPWFNDAFGVTAAISGNTVVVGAYNEDSNATGVNGDQGNEDYTNAGAAYVFVRNGTTWSQEAYLKASNTGPADMFGSAAAIADDTVVVGAFHEDSSTTGVNGDQGNDDSTDSGAAYVFVRNGTTWSQEAYLKASNSGANDEFGLDASIDGDTVVVGAWKEDSDTSGVNGEQDNDLAEDSGAAYVFVRNGMSWSQEAYLKASNTGADDAFGRAVSASNDMALVGARGEDSSATGANGNQGDNSASFSGAAYVFARSGTTWNQETYLKASNTETGDGFGGAVAASACTVVVGALFEDSGSAGVNGDQGDNSVSTSGAAYVFELGAAIAFRNGGSNPASYAASPIVIGAPFTATVDNNLASQVTSLLFALDTPFTLTLGGGQTLLCLDLGSGELFTGGALAPSSSLAGIDSYVLAVPDDLTLCGLALRSQAIQFGSPPFDLSNAQDLTIGSF